MPSNSDSIIRSLGFSRTKVKMNSSMKTFPALSVSWNCWNWGTYFTRISWKNLTSTSPWFLIFFLRSRKNEADFARQKSHNLKKEIVNILPEYEETKIQQQASDIKKTELPKKTGLNEDNFSYASFKTVQTSATMENNLLSKENIIFQKYMYGEFNWFGLYKGIERSTRQNTR